VITKRKLEEAFMGAVTVGERGQVVIPAEAREVLEIAAGDKLLVFLPPHGHMVAFAKLSDLQSAVEEFQRLIEHATEEED